MQDFSRELSVWKEFEKGQKIYDNLGIKKSFEEYQKFKNGDQWPSATKRTRNLPRPVFNIVDMFIKSKRAAILNQNVGIQYSPFDVEKHKAEAAISGAKKFTDYSKEVWEAVGQDILNAQCLDDAATLGTGILHYYFDTSITGGKDFKYVGEICGEVIDPLNVVFACNQISDVQKQKYVIVSTEKTLKDTLKLCFDRGNTKITGEKIKREAFENAVEDYDFADKSDDEKKLIILTKYYKIGGEVFYDICTRTVLISEKIPLAPWGQKPITLYPLAIMQWNLKKEAIFGIGEAQGLIPNQKAINFNYAMMLLSVQQTAWPKLVTKPNALQQPVTNEPGEHLIDYYSQGSGISYLNPPNFSGFAINLSDKVLDVTRTVSGVPQALTGEVVGSNMAASAIIALQSQAKAPINETQKRFWGFIKQVGKIWEQFFKAYIITERKITAFSDANKKDADGIITFKGSDYSELDFDLKVDAGPSSEYGESLSQATLEMLLNRGDIDAKQYVRLAPDNIVPFREQLLKMWSENQLNQDKDEKFEQVVIK